MAQLRNASVNLPLVLSVTLNWLINYLNVYYLLCIICIFNQLVSLSPMAKENEQRFNGGTFIFSSYILNSISSKSS